MADRGWVLNGEEQRWELRSDWDRVHGWLTVEFADRAGPEHLAGVVARAGWPELVPGVPWWHLVLLGGPADGQHVWLHPREEPPPVLLVADPQLTAVALPPPVRPVAYRRRYQACGHGRACAWPYLLTDTAAYPRVCAE